MILFALIYSKIENKKADAFWTNAFCRAEFRILRSLFEFRALRLLSKDLAPINAEPA